MSKSTQTVVVFTSFASRTYLVFRRLCIRSRGWMLSSLMCVPLCLTISCPQYDGMNGVRCHRLRFLSSVRTFLHPFYSYNIHSLVSLSDKTDSLGGDGWLQHEQLRILSFTRALSAGDDGVPLGEDLDGSKNFTDDTKWSSERAKWGVAFCWYIYTHTYICFPRMIYSMSLSSRPSLKWVLLSQRFPLFPEIHAYTSPF